MEFIVSAAFTRHLPEYLSDEEYRALQKELASHPEAGDLMPGTGGFRKLRWIDPKRGKGRQGGLRIIYYHLARDREIWLMTLFDKHEASDLSPKEKKALKQAIGAELAARKVEQRRRKARPRRDQ